MFGSYGGHVPSIRCLVALLALFPLPFPLSVASSPPHQAAYLSRLEHGILTEHNLVRENPREYAAHLEAWLQYFEGTLLQFPGEIPLRTQEGATAVEEAADFLKSVPRIDTLRTSRGLSRAAADHVSDQGPLGAIGHDGTDGSKPWDRSSRYGTWLGSVGENIAFGTYDDDSGRRIVMQLLIDDGVPERGHRSNIFNQDFRVAGVACGKHATYEVMCVIVYAGGYQERAGGTR